MQKQTATEEPGTTASVAHGTLKAKPFVRVCRRYAGRRPQPTVGPVRRALPPPPPLHIKVNPSHHIDGYTCPTSKTPSEAEKNDMAIYAQLHRERPTAPIRPLPLLGFHAPSSRPTTLFSPPMLPVFLDSPVCCVGPPVGPVCQATDGYASCACLCVARCRAFVCRVLLSHDLVEGR